MEMKFFLGCAFYHSRMKLMFTDTKTRTLIDNIHGCLYGFSMSKLDYLSEWAPYKLLVHHFLAHYSPDFIGSSRFSEDNRSDIRAGLAYLQNDPRLRLPFVQ